MNTEPEKLIVRLNEQDIVSALLYSASRRDKHNATVILGHGAGAGQLSPFMRLFASGLAERGVDALTFNFVYMEEGRRVPDRGPKLESCYTAVIDAALHHKRLTGNRIFIGGKSMGGRIASQVAALLGNAGFDKNKNALPDGRATAPISGLVFLGYPLHPPGKPEQLRDKHLAGIQAPMLFVQGSRDAFGTADEIQTLMKRLKLNATLYRIEGGDHSLKVNKGAGLTQDQVYHSVISEIVRWVLA
jgi:uncharacterized protein